MKRRTVGQKLVAIMLVVMMVWLGSGQVAASAGEVSGTGADAKIQDIRSPGVSYPFSDDVENPAADNWLAYSPWSRTTADSHSGNTS